MDSAKDNYIKYSILTLSNPKEFICQEIKNDFEVTTEIICAFSKRPLQMPKIFKNDFFKVSTYINKDTFFVSIKPFYKIKLIPEVFNLMEDDTVYQANVVVSHRWSILGYKDKMPLIKNEEKSEIGINFPFFLDKDKLPYVGSLDIKGNPVHIKKVDDVTDYLKIKKYYKQKRYELCMDMIDDILEKYPKTLFKAELIYYKIKVYSKLKDYDNVISNAKIYLREYSGDENIPEILSLVANAYANIGLNIDADYFFDRLFSEHPNSVYTQWAYIYKAQMLEDSGGETKAEKYYKKALRETNDVDVASTAAYNLAHMKLGVSYKESIKYINKIIKAKPSYFMEDMHTSMEMMNTLGSEGYYKTAADIANAILNEINPTYDEYEALVKDRAIWLSKTKYKKEALKAINKYLKEFPDGDYINEIQVAKDALFFETSELNVTAKLNEYDKLIDEYKNDTIGERAIYEKAKLLLESKKYNDVLNMKDLLFSIDRDKYNDVEDIVKKAATGVMKISLENKECKDVLVVSSEYNVTLSNKWDDGIYECSMKGGDFQLAKKITMKNLKSKDLESRKKWLFRYIKVDFSTGNYTDVVDASKDLIKLIEDDKDSKYKEVYRYIFDTYERLDKQDDMINAMAKIEDVFGLDYKDIDRYVAMMSIGSDRKDDNMVIKYGTKITQIQNSSSSHPQSPYVEFTLYQSYMNKEDYNKALDVIKSLDSIELSKTDRARQKYLLGTVLTKLWRDEQAQNAYKDSIKADPKSAWAKLAKSAMNM
jgi:tetratricopeptide (TPR) repeat protein